MLSWQERWNNSWNWEDKLLLPLNQSSIFPKDICCYFSNTSRIERLIVFWLEGVSYSLEMLHKMDTHVH